MGEQKNWRKWKRKLSRVIEKVSHKDRTKQELMVIGYSQDEMVRGGQETMVTNKIRVLYEYESATTMSITLFTN